MNSKRWVFSFLILITLACNAITQGLGVVTPPAPTESVPTVGAATVPPVATATPVVTATPVATATPSVLAALFDSVYIPPACQNKPLATLAPDSVVAQPTPDLPPNPTVDAALQQQVFDDLVKTINDVYLYTDFNGLDWPSIIQKYQAKLDGGLDTETFYLEMEHFVFELGDEHSQFQSPAIVAATDAELSGTNNYVGIGVVVKPLLDKSRVTILTVFPKSTAEHSGLKSHDSILAADGVPIIENGEVHLYRVRGPECTVVRLTVQSPGEEPRDVAVMRARIKEPQPVVARLLSTTDSSRIGYILIPTFFDETIPGQVRAALEKFGPLDGLILDNRLNSGGSSSVVEPIFGFFTKGVIGNFKSRFGQRSLNITGDPVDNSQEVPIVILVGEDTVSFGEIFSGAMRDIGRAQIVGQTTLGNVETLHGYDFADGSRAWIAEERFVPLHTQDDWEKTGIVPDVEAFADWDTFTFETDPAVLAAAKLLGH